MPRKTGPLASSILAGINDAIAGRGRIVRAGSRAEALKEIALGKTAAELQAMKPQPRLTKGDLRRELDRYINLARAALKLPNP